MRCFPSAATRIRTALAGFAFAVAAASAAGVPARAQTPDCAHAVTQTDLNACSALEALAAAKRLAATYARVRAKYQGSAVLSKLGAAQSAWLTFRDRDCGFSADRYAGGSIQPLIRYGCLAQRDRERTSELEGYLREGG